MKTSTQKKLIQFAGFLAMLTDEVRESDLLFLKEGITDHERKKLAEETVQKRILIGQIKTVMNTMRRMSEKNVNRF